MDDSSLKDLPPLASRLKQGHNHSTSYQLSNNSHLISSLLHERGPSSHAMYQPDVNHRVTEEVYFNEHTVDETGKRQIPMMQSFVSRQESCMFTFGNPISYIHYQAHKVADASVLSPCLKIRTHLPMAIKHSKSRDGSGRFVGRGVLSGLKAGFCSLSAFMKLISLFGFKLGSAHTVTSNDNADYPDIARIEHWHSFLSSFDEKLLDWTTKEKFIAFLDAYPSLGYKYDESLSLRQNINVLSYWIRARCPVRAAIPDGQHRGQVLTYGLVGNFEITSHAPLREFGVDEWGGVPGQGKLLSLFGSVPSGVIC